MFHCPKKFQLSRNKSPTDRLCEFQCCHIISCGEISNFEDLSSLVSAIEKTSCRAAKPFWCYDRHYRNIQCKYFVLYVERYSAHINHPSLSLTSKGLFEIYSVRYIAGYNSQHQYKDHQYILHRSKNPFNATKCSVYNLSRYIAFALKELFGRRSFGFTKSSQVAAQAPFCLIHDFRSFCTFWIY